MSRNDPKPENTVTAHNVSNSERAAQAAVPGRASHCENTRAMAWPTFDQSIKETRANKFCLPLTVVAFSLSLLLGNTATQLSFFFLKQT